MKKIYVCHEFQGKKSNKEAINHICRNLTRLGVMPISPVHSYAFLHDNIPEEREKAIQFCKELVEMADELWLFGEWHKFDGCIIERNVALLELIPIYEVSGWHNDMPIFNGEGPKWMRRMVAKS